MSIFSTLFSAAITAIPKDAANGVSTLGSITRSVTRYPIKAFATFFMAPILIVRVARVTKNPIRRLIASIGLFLAVLLSYISGTFLGSVVGALFVASHVGWLVGLGFLVGSTLSVFLSLIFSIFVLNATSWIFLQMSAEDVVEHLNSVSK